jgi:hypothetical protein
MYKTGFPPEDKVGLDRVAGWAVRNGGSIDFPKDMIDDELEFIGASIESDAGSQVGQIRANFLTKDTETVLAILADLIRSRLRPRKDRTPEEEYCGGHKKKGGRS